MAYLIGTDVDALYTAEAVFGVEPASKPKAGAELAEVSDGGQVWRGYPCTTWLFKAIPVATYKTAITTTLNIAAGAAYGDVVIYTRDEYDTFAYWEAIIRLPDPATLERWGAQYLNVALEFVLLNTTAPTPP